MLKISKILLVGHNFPLKLGQYQNRKKYREIKVKRMEKEVSLIGHEPTYAQRGRVHSYHVRLHTHRGGHMRKGGMNLNLGQTHRVQVTI